MTPINDTVRPEDWAALEAELPKKRWSGKRIVGVLALFALFAAALYGAHRMNVRAPAPVPAYVEVPALLIGLRGNGGETRHLRVRVIIAAEPGDAAAIRARLPVVIDGFQSFLRELRPEDLAGASGTYRIKEELMIRVNRASAPARASDVLIQELVQQ